MAPEVLLGGEPSQAADLYSFGVLMWEVITGERPQRGCLRMPAVPAECSQEACDLMVACLSLDPAARPTAADLLRQLTRLKRAESAPAGDAAAALSAACAALQMRSLSSLSAS